MLIVDTDKNGTLESILLLLTPSEAKELAGSAADLSAHPEKHHHHINDATFEREITIAVYTPDNIAEFSNDLRPLIRREMLKQDADRDK